MAEPSLFGDEEPDTIETSGAEISACGLYRYGLWRGWSAPNGPTIRLTFVMLNPSTADAATDDPTIRRCIGFARREGYAGICVVNLFALRATDPDVMLSADDPIGPDNNHHIAGALALGDPIVCAWGAHFHPAISRRAHDVTEILRPSTGRVYCLGRTQAGAPRHPLYLASDTPLQDFLTGDQA